MKACALTEVMTEGGHMVEKRNLAEEGGHRIGMRRGLAKEEE